MSRIKHPNLRVLSGVLPFNAALPPELEPAVLLKDIELPDALTPDQQKIWKETLAKAPSGLLKDLDFECFRAWVILADMNRKASQKLFGTGDDCGMTIKTTNGNIIQSPHVGIFNRSTELLAKLTEQLGFSPTGRARIAKGAEKASKNPFAKHSEAAKRRA